MGATPTIKVATSAFVSSSPLRNLSMIPSIHSGCGHDRSAIAVTYAGIAQIKTVIRTTRTCTIRLTAPSSNVGLIGTRASLPGTDPDLLAAPLSYLYYHHLAPPALRARALPERFVDMRRLDPAALDPARMLAALPPLIKGYLRLGGFVGDGAVIDRQFNTTDVCIVVKTDLVAEKYSRHYERQSKETWAA